MLQAERLLLFLVCLLASDVAQAAHSERVRLRDVEVLTLQHGKWTTGRRTRPVQQLTCIGGTNRCKFLPPTVQCYNRGSDGQDVQWECKAVMDKNLRFNKIEVTCEGFDFPEDDYVLVGSCGLEYSIDRIDGKTPFPEPHFSRPDPRSMPHKINRDQEPGFGTLLGLAVVASLMYLIYTNCVKPNHPSPTAAGPPPPGFRPQYNPPPSASPADGPGFWSGMGMGGLAGYLFGRQQAPSAPTYTTFSADESTGSPSHETRNESYGWFGSTRRRRTDTPAAGGQSSESTESSVATGFGGTKRR